MVAESGAEEVRRLKAESGDMVVWDSLTLATSLIRQRLVDKYRRQV